MRMKAGSLRKMDRGMSGKFVASGLAALAMLLAGTGSAKAAEGAELVFESGGRIMSVKADGTGRVNLTPGREPDSYLDVESEPVVSPDGERIAYIDHIQPDQGRSFRQLVITNRNGRNRKVLLDSRDYPRDGAPFAVDWLGNTQLMAVDYFGSDRKHRFIVTRIVAVRVDGSGQKVQYRRIYRGTRDSTVDGIDVSPDRRFVLIDSSSGNWTPSLEIMDRRTGKVRTVRRKADNGTWSPDGSMIAFDSEETFVRRHCEFGDCWGDSKIFLMGRNGKGVHRLTRGKVPGDETEAAWSPDGSRIAFTDTRNNPDMGRAGREIYTVRTDGSCLTWITNGTPASTNPSWGPETDGSTEPARCGENNLKPAIDLLPEADPLVNGEPITWPRLWLGPIFQGRGQTESPDDGRELLYQDCVRFRAADCRSPVYGISSDDVCLSWVQQLNGFGQIGRVLFRRGALVFLPSDRASASESIVLTGGQAVMVSPTRRGSGRRLPVSVHLKVIDGLRQVGEASADSDLEPPVLDSTMPVRAKRVARAVERGSVASAAANLKMGRAEVRGWLRIHRALDGNGPFETTSCKGWL